MIRSYGLSLAAGASLGLAGNVLLFDTDLNPQQRAVNQPAQCAAPPGAAVHSVEELIAQRQSPTAADQLMKHRQQFQSGFRILDATATSTSTETQHYLAAADKMLASYGVSIAFAPNSAAAEAPNQLHINANRTNKSQPNTNLDATGRYDVKKIITGISDLPGSYIHFSGLKKVLLYRANRDADQAYVIADGSTRNDHLVYFNLAGRGNNRDMPHEIYHLIDRRECGANGMNRDPAFSDQNGSAIYTGAHPSVHVLTNGPIQTEVNRLQSQQTPAEYASNKARYESLRGQISSLLGSITSPSNYSLNNETEDKAEIGATFASPLAFADTLNPSTPRLRAKTVMLLARLFENAPQAARQLLSTAIRPNSVDSLYTNVDTYNTDIHQLHIARIVGSYLKKHLPRPRPGQPTSAVGCSSESHGIVTCSSGTLKSVRIRVDVRP